MSLSSERYREIALASPERSGDRAIRRGDFSGALDYFEKAIRGREMPYDRKGRIVAKELALPLYELEWRRKIGSPIDKDLEAHVESCHANVAELLNVCLQDMASLRRRSNSPTNVAPNLGLASELTLFTLGTRRLNRKGDFFFVPSSTDEDFSGPFASDLRLIANSGLAKSSAVQVKTSRRTRNVYSTAVNVVAIQDLDPRYYGTPDHPNSLASKLGREIKGTADSHTLAQLNELEDQFFEKLGKQFMPNDSFVAS